MDVDVDVDIDVAVSIERLQGICSSGWVCICRGGANVSTGSDDDDDADAVESPCDGFILSGRFCILFAFLREEDEADPGRISSRSAASSSA